MIVILGRHQGAVSQSVSHGSKLQTQIASSALSKSSKRCTWKQAVAGAMLAMLARCGVPLVAAAGLDRAFP
jgi:hypothetical protein